MHLCCETGAVVAAPVENLIRFLGTLLGVGGADYAISLPSGINDSLQIRRVYSSPPLSWINRFEGNWLKFSAFSNLGCLPNGAARARARLNMQ